MCINHHNKLKLFESPTFPTWVETIDVSLQWSPFVWVSTTAYDYFTRTFSRSIILRFLLSYGNATNPCQILDDGQSRAYQCLSCRQSMSWLGEKRRVKAHTCKTQMAFKRAYSAVNIVSLLNTRYDLKSMFRVLSHTWTRYHKKTKMFRRISSSSTPTKISCRKDRKTYILMCLGGIAWNPLSSLATRHGWTLQGENAAKA